MSPDAKVSLFSGTSHPSFAGALAKYLSVPLGNVLHQPFLDGELFVQLLDSVRGRDVFVVQTIARDPNNYLVELLLMVDALKRASAKSIVAVLPYFGYARQDRKDKPRVPITAKLIADLLETAGVSHVLTMDLHSGQIQGFFNVPVDNLFARPLLAEACQSLGRENLVVMGPDLGAIKMARAFSNQLKADFAVIDKRRVSSGGKVEVYAIIGEVKEKDIILVDDMCSTGGTLVAAAEACKKEGAKRIFAAFTHPLLVGEALSALEASPIEKIFTTDSIPLSPEAAKSKKIVQISVSHLFGEAIKRIISADSISSIFN